MELFDLHQIKRRIARIPLFGSVGLPMPNANPLRILQWDAWFGPEDPRSLAISIRQQELHDILVPVESEQEWLAALNLVVDHARALIPYDPDEDAWYAPNAATWSAAWTFSLEQWHTASGVRLPDDISAQLVWYEQGHWPCALVDGMSGTHLEDYVIF